MGKNSFVLYYNYKDQLEDLTNEQIGELLRAIFDYEIDGTVPEFDSLEAKVAFKFIKKDLDANREKYEEVCQKNRGNGQKGGRPKNQVVNDETQNNRTVIAKTQENRTVIMETEQNPSEPKKPDNDNDNVNDNDYMCVSNDTHNSGCMGKKPQKHRFGKYKNVLLTDAEYKRLVNKPDGEKAIEYLSQHRELKGYKCKNDNLAIHKWVFTAVKEQEIREARVNQQYARIEQKTQQSTSNPFLNLTMQGGATK